MHAFLSPEWIEAAREIRARYDDELPEVTASIRINQVITEVPFGDGVLHAHVDTTNGDVSMELGELDDADATIVADYLTAYAMIVERDPTALMGALMAGKLQIQGDLMQLMSMQATMPANTLSDQVAEEIRAITIPPEPQPDDHDGDDHDGDDQSEQD